MEAVIDTYLSNLIGCILIAQTLQPKNFTCSWRDIFIVTFILSSFYCPVQERHFLHHAIWIAEQLKNQSSL